MKRLHWFSNRRWLHKVDSGLAMKAEWLPTQALLTVMNLLTLLPFTFTGIRVSISGVVKISHTHLGRVPLNHLGLWWWTFSLWVWEDFSDVFSLLHHSADPFLVQRWWRKRIMVLNNTLQSKHSFFLRDLFLVKSIWKHSQSTSQHKICILKVGLRGQQDTGRVGSTR